MQSSTGYMVNVALPVAPAGVVFRALREAVREAGELQQQAWLKLADGEVVNRLTGAYIAGLRSAESFQFSPQTSSPSTSTLPRISCRSDSG